MSGYLEESGEQRKETSRTVRDSLEKTSEYLILNDQGGSQMSVSENVSGCLRAQEHGHQPIVFEPGAASRVGGHVYEDICGSLRANAGDNQQAVLMTMQAIGEYKNAGCASSLKQRDYKDATDLVVVTQDAYDKYSISDGVATLRQSGGVYGGERSIGNTVGALCARDYKGVGSQYVEDGKLIIERSNSI